MQRTNHLPRKRGSILCIILFAVVAVGCSGYSVAAPMSPELLALSAELRETPRVAAGDRFVLAIKDGRVYAWGTNENVIISEHGDIPHSRDNPVVIPIPEKVVSVSAGRMHAIALTEDGEVWTWGNGYYGALGSIQPNVSPTRKLSWASREWRFKPFKVEGLPRIVKISASSGHNLALTSHGEVWAWGNNRSGAAADDPSIDISAPHIIKSLSSIDNIFALSGGSFAIKNGKVYVWGYNNEKSNQLLIDKHPYIFNPEKLDDFPCSVKGISSGLGAAFFICNNGSVNVVGYSLTGELGLGRIKSQRSLMVHPDLKAVIKITGNSPHMALLDSGEVKAWGSNNYGVPEFSGSKISTPKYINKINREIKAIDIISYRMNAYIIGSNGLVYKLEPKESFFIKGLYKMFNNQEYKPLKYSDGKYFNLLK